MTSWYYMDSNLETHGPLEENQILDLIRSRDITLDTPAWEPGQDKFKPVKEIHRLMDLSTIPVEKTSESEEPVKPLATQDISPSPSPAAPRPWVRYWARMMDLCLWGLILGMPLSFIIGNDIIFSILMVCTLPLIEPVLLAYGRNTPGKTFFRVKITMSNGRKPTYTEFLYRTLNVILKGLGLGLPIISQITCVASYLKLKENGITSWDKEGDFAVVHDTVGTDRIIMAVIFFIIIIVLSRL